jgi:hypothetical protein
MLAALMTIGKPNFRPWNFRQRQMSAPQGLFEYSGSGA